MNQTVERIIRFALDCQQRKTSGNFDVEGHDALACAIAEQGAVLLKNEGNILPVKSEDMALIGYMAKVPRYQGSGSSHINPTKLTSLTDALPDGEYHRQELWRQKGLFRPGL